MKIADVLLLDFESQITNTRRTLERVPEERKDWRPHAKSMPLGKLAMHCATLPNLGRAILEEPGMDMAAPRRPHIPLVLTSREACLAQLEESAAACRSALAGATDEELMATWPFRLGERLISEKTRAQTFRQVFFDHMVHHLAQLGVYLRLNDVAVPGLYGPSADEM